MLKQAALMAPVPPSVQTLPTRCEANLLVFADDWGRHPSSCQYLVRELLQPGDTRGIVETVNWVNTIGTRTPRLNLSTARRGLEKLTHWFSAADSRHSTFEFPNLRVLNPWMWPWCGSSLGRTLNCRLLVRQLKPVLGSLPEPPVAVTTIPIVADVLDQLPVRRWVYYCVDDFAQWPGLDKQTLQEMETRLIERADVLIAVSETLREKLARRGRSAHLLTHGVDLDTWIAPTHDSPRQVLHDLERPLIVFWGVVDRRMDTQFIERLSADLQQGTIALIGPAADHDPALDQLPRVRRLDAVPPERLPGIASEAAVLIMPYAELPVTQAMQPLKLKEYLATGKPAVVRNLPAMRDWADCLDAVDSATSFSEVVRQRLQTGLPEDQRLARKRLAKESWSEKARLFAEWALR
jgi:glycosyltransferase involved in cell wall biosynthesis